MLKNDNCDVWRGWNIRKETNHSLRRTAALSFRDYYSRGHWTQVNDRSQDVRACQCEAEAGCFNHSFRRSGPNKETQGRSSCYSRCANVHAELCGEYISQWKCTKYRSPAAKCSMVAMEAQVLIMMHPLQVIYLGLRGSPGTYLSCSVHFCDASNSLCPLGWLWSLFITIGAVCALNLEQLKFWDYLYWCSFPGNWNFVVNI